jgi:hypothetical protein
VEAGNGAIRCGVGDRGQHVLLQEKTGSGHESDLLERSELRGLFQECHRVGAGHEAEDAVDLVGLDCLHERSLVSIVGKGRRHIWPDDSSTAGRECLFESGN